jgi:hypothetical protein
VEELPMFQLLERYLRRDGERRRRIELALRLERRGEARKDGLQLDSLQHRLEIRWQAREVHPWDRHLPWDQRRRRFVEQALLDTEAALVRLFGASPEVDVIDFRVAEPASGATMLSGAIARADCEAARSSPSVRMRLSEMGVNFESLEVEHSYQLRA